MILIWIIIAISIFSLVILIHEFWHFFIARKFNVKVLEFWLWIPPKAKEIFTDKLWTKYTLNWLPLWGFVRLNWEESIKNRDFSDKTKFYNKTYIQKSAILLAWVFMNFLLAILIFSILFFIWIKPIWINTQIKTDLDLKLIPNYEQALESGILIKKPWIIVNPIKWSLAEKAWIKKNDILLKINDIEINNIENLKKILEKNKNKIIEIKTINKKFKIKLNNTWKIWAYIWENIEVNKKFKYKYWILNSVKYWTLETYNQTLLTFKWIWILGQKIFNPKKPEERKEALNQMSWPIWIVDFISNSFSAWIMFLAFLTAIISINLWVFNLLPIPALDWWRWLLLTINIIITKIFKNKIKLDNIENIIHIIFFIILIALSILIWYNDIEKIINR